MNKIYTETEGIILPKGISLVPYSNEVQYKTFSKALGDNKMSAGNKIYWLSALFKKYC